MLNFKLVLLWNGSFKPFANNVLVCNLQKEIDAIYWHTSFIVLYHLQINRSLPHVRAAMFKT